MNNPMITSVRSSNAAKLISQPETTKTSVEIMLTVYKKQT